MNILVHITVLFLLTNRLHGRSIDDIENSITQSKQLPESHDWVQISEIPPLKLIQPLGSTVELECEVTGSPLPTVNWVRGKNYEANANGFASNLISESSPNSLVRVRSRLLVDVDDSEDNMYTCVGQAGPKTVHATSTIFSSGTPFLNQHNISLNRNPDPRKPRIVYYYSVIFEEMGSNIVLPCKAAGRPHPDIYWLDTNENIIDGRDPRIRVLPTGELLLSYLRWSDMGTFTCVAQNALAKDSASTFVYPVLADY